MIFSIRKHSIPFVTLLVMLLFSPQNAIAQEFEWVKSEFDGHMFNAAIKTDAAGNIYTVGRFIGTVDFDPGPDEAYITAFGIGSDIFIRKMNPEGDLIWAKSIEGAGYDDQPRALDVSPDGNEIYISGFFQDSADFDPGIDTYMLNTGGYLRNNFALKLDGDGNFQWAHTISGTDFFHLETRIKRDVDGNVTFTGMFSGTQDFDPATGILDTYLLNSGGGIATFVQKVDADGTFMWADRLTNAKMDNAFIDEDLNIFLVGSYIGEADFDPGPDEFFLDSEGYRNGFAVKLDAEGNFEWAQDFIGEDYVELRNVGIDNEGNIVCSGIFDTPVDFDPGPELFELSPVGEYDHFFLKLGPFGDLIWAKSIGGTENEWPSDLEINAEDEIYIMGASVSEEIDLDPGVDEEIVPNYGGIDFYILKLDEAGNLIWTKHSEGPSGENITASYMNNEDQLFLTGSFGETVDFDFCPTAEYELTEIESGSPAYIMKLSYCEVYGDTIAAEECESYTTSYGSTYTETGTYYEVLDGECNCDSLITYEISIIEIDTSIFQVGNELTANEDHPEATYQWIDCNHGFSPITDETDQVYMASEDGEYAVIITIGECVDTTACVTFSTVGMQQNELDLYVSIYPNPTNGQFNIQFGKEYETVEVIVRNIAGEIISNSVHNKAQSISMEIEQAKGVYFIEIITEKGEQAFVKLILQ